MDKCTPFKASVCLVMGATGVSAAVGISFLVIDLFESMHRVALLIYESFEYLLAYCHPRAHERITYPTLF